MTALAATMPMARLQAITTARQRRLSFMVSWNSGPRLEVPASASRGRLAF
jgi:hypothetical protein